MEGKGIKMCLDIFLICLDEFVNSSRGFKKVLDAFKTS